MQEAALDILHFLDGIAGQRRRRDVILSSAVASGAISVVQAWPEFFGGPDEGDQGAFPSKGADMSGFVLEEATPQSFASDMAALVAASQTVVVREEAPPPLPVVAGHDPEHQYVPHPEWT